MAKRRKIEAPVTPATIAAAVLGGGVGPAPMASPARHFSAQDYFNWCESTCFTLDKASNAWVPFRFTDWQRTAWERLLTLTDDGRLNALTWMLCWPRRHGKSQLGGYYDIQRCLSYSDQNVIVCANSADQSEETVFRLITDTLLNSPSLKRKVDAGKIVVGTTDIYFAETGSRITCIPHSEASAYGKRIHVAHNTELCKARTDAVYQVLASSTGDAWCGLVICDSNVGDESNAVVNLLKLSGVHFRQGAIERGPPDDPSIVASFVGYESLDDAAARGPAWIPRPWLDSRRLQMTAGEFRRNHLNVPSSGAEVCFPLALVRRAFVDDLPLVVDLTALAAIRTRYQHHALHIGGGLDRALGLSVKTDRTVWTVAASGCRPDLLHKSMPVYSEDGSPLGEMPADPWEYTILRQYVVPMAMDHPLKDAILADRKLFGRFTRVSLESYQARDIYDWCLAQRIEAEIVHMTWQAQSNLVRMMVELLSTNRLRISAANTLLYHELLNYREDCSGSTPSYGGPKRTIRIDQSPDQPTGDAAPPRHLAGGELTIKDDALESAMWALWSLRAAKKRPPPGSAPRKPPGF